MAGKQGQSALMPILAGEFADAELGRSLDAAYHLLFFEHDIPSAENALHATLDLATTRGNTCAEGLSDFALGLAAQQNDATKAQDWFGHAETAFSQAHSASGLAHAHYGLATVLIHAHSEAESHTTFLAVASELERAGDPVYALFARLEAVIPTAADAPEEFARLIAEAQTLNVPEAEASVWHRWGDAEFSLARYDQAMLHYQKADALYAACLCEPTQRAYLQTSMGRLERVQGRPQVSIEHYRLALRLQTLGHDHAYMPQTLNAISVAYEAMHRYPMAIVYEKRALAYAQKIHSQQFINFLEPSLGYLYFQSGQPLRGLPLLERAVAREKADYRLCIRYDQLSEIYLTLGRRAEAEDSATRSMAACKSAKDHRGLSESLETRARIRLARNELDGALGDARQSLALIEQIREHLVPEDAHKRGYNEQSLNLYETSIAVLTRMHHYAEALEVTEQSRARAFLDLLSSPHAKITAEAAPASFSKTSLRKTAMLRGGQASGLSNETLIASVAHTTPMTTDEMVATVARLHSTMLAYWVSKDTLYLWVVRAGQPVYETTRQIKAVEIERLVRAANPFEEPSTGRGIRTRGGEALGTNLSTRTVWRKLYRLLIEPVEAELPTEPGSLLTIVPSGPLFELPFAALVDEHGHYLVERYALHTVPAAGLLTYTEKNETAAEKLTPHYLFVANPNRFPRIAAGYRLPPLPGTGAEVKSIAETLPASEVTLLEGSRADMAHLLQALPSATVLHFATHAIVSDSDPFGSFLALDAPPGQTAESGLLTAEDIYGMHLHTRMVVLSACRTGRGPISGDGVAGLSRAFFYAGSASVLTTMWDVADAPTALLMPLFYQGTERGQSRAEALRNAQLALIHQLRAGRVRVSVAGREIALPESPVYWAAFSLSGQP
ncbi:CHAT domain-containing tetratricopeptide repeat protein [Edaphobacter sp.]|uniref:CHAT domain-containing tetratricopeptide repeat protein n=1 Tax=Edaphobacter sp. TaxID=1934404 RepID=UPI002DBC1CE2|nr:CHAT domain-containing protein [Edaphobacter sp.]HEU5340018.1 CHAT domain-containing protein [Edaphobacter sp.]